jgi:tetratricopeptide (TPR) repeat protein
MNLQQALALFGDLGHRYGEAWALHHLGVLQKQTGDYPAATASFQQALKLFRDFGYRLGEAQTLTSLAAYRHEPGAPSRPGSITPGHLPSPATSACPWRKHPP